MNQSSEKTAIFAGGGSLPAKVKEACIKKGRIPFVIGFDGQTDPAITDFMTQMGAAGAIIKKLKDENVRDIIFIGGIKRPSFKNLKPDLKGTKILAKIGFKSLGDDSLLKLIADELKKEGFNLISAQDVLDDVLAPQGVWTTTQPNEQDLSDIRRGEEVARSLGLADVGQSVVVQDGIVLAVEAIEGTDALLDRCAELVKTKNSGVLVKLKKPQQDERLDLPTVGVVTMEKIHAAGLKGLAVKSGQTLVVGLDDMIAFANKHGLYITGL